MSSDYEKGVAILRLIRSGDSDWIAKVLLVRSGHPAVPQFQEIRLNTTTETVTPEEASRALHWADAIYLTEKFSTDDRLIEAITERNQKVSEARQLIAQAEAELRGRIAALQPENPTEADVLEILEMHALLVAEAEQRKNACARSWREINRERVLAHSAASRSAQGKYRGRSWEEVQAEEDARRRDMELFRAWIEREEKKHDRSRWKT